MTLTIDQVLHTIQQRIDALDDTRIYYKMRKYRFKHIFPQTVSLVKICIAIDSLGLPINTSIVRPFMNKHDLHNKLHHLGDKHILILKRTLKGAFLEWTLHPAFQHLVFNGDQNE